MVIKHVKYVTQVKFLQKVQIIFTIQEKKTTIHKKESSRYNVLGKQNQEGDAEDVQKNQMEDVTSIRKYKLIMYTIRAIKQGSKRKS